MQIAIARRAFMDSSHCGDQYGWWRQNGTVTLCIVDGLGHGKEAEIAGKAAVEYVEQHVGEPLVELLTGCDKAIRGTRGVAMGLAQLTTATGELEFAGVGNTRTRLVATGQFKPKSSFLSSAYGIIGGGFRKVVPETVSTEPGDLLFMYTDGLKEMFDLSGYRDLKTAEAEPLARQVLKDWKRDSDDGAVLVARME